MDNVDPTQFLAQENDDELDQDKHPPILASLGLTHISQVGFSNSYSICYFDINDFLCFTLWSIVARYRQYK